MIKQARREWVGKWVWFDLGDGTGIQEGLVVLINVVGEVYVSYDFDERGCEPKAVVSMIDDISRALMLVGQE